MVGQRPLAQVIVQTGLAAAEARDVIGVADTSRRAVAAHPSVSKMDRAANSFSNRGLCETGRSSAARNSVHAASVSTKSRRSASTSRACANAAVTVKLVRSVPSASAARRISASYSGVRRAARRSVFRSGLVAMTSIVCLIGVQFNAGKPLLPRLWRSACRRRRCCVATGMTGRGAIRMPPARHHTLAVTAAPARCNLGPI